MGSFNIRNSDISDIKVGRIYQVMHEELFYLFIYYNLYCNNN